MANKRMLDGVLTTLNALALLEHRNAKPKQTRRASVTRRQVYDAKRGQIITLTTETVTYTENR